MQQKRTLPYKESLACVSLTQIVFLKRNVESFLCSNRPWLLDKVNNVLAFLSFSRNIPSLLLPMPPTNV